MKKQIILLIVLGLTATFANAQFPIKIPKIKIPKVEQPKPENTPQPSNNPTQNNQSNNSVSNNNTQSIGGLNRQMVMDDGVTFFDAEPVKERDPQTTLNKDIGWKMKADLRILGTFPNRSAFKMVIKKNGNALATIRCEGTVYTKANDSSLRTPIQREGRDLNFEDFMTSGLGCADENEVIIEIGNLDVDIYYIDGDSDAETLVRTYKIDVHKATRVRGGPRNTFPDVADYYIQRHAEEAVAIAYLSPAGRGEYFQEPVITSGTVEASFLRIYTTYSPAEGSLRSTNSFARCSVNGQRIKIERDGVTVNEVQVRQEFGSYSDRNTAKYKNQGTPYKDWIEFVGLEFQLPIFTGTRKITNNARLEDHPGKWECSIITNSKIYRTFRWEVANGRIVPHGEQQNGNINLFQNTALIDMEIPAGGSPIDFRLMPMPNAGLFYGIPWTTAEGKAMAARVPKLGNPYPVPSTQAK